MTAKKTTYTQMIKELLLSEKGEKKCCRESRRYAENFVKNGAIIERTLFKCDECKNAFLREVFVLCASVNSPEKSNHLEFKLKTQPNADELCLLLSDCGFEGKISHRKNMYIVYFKDADTIFELLSFIGANKYAFEILNMQIEKQIRNNCNRVANCEYANVRKTIDASMRVLDAIKQLEEDGILETLPEKIVETALLKKQNPYASLSALAQMHEVPVTRSCVNHRLEKLVNMVEKNIK